MITITCDKCDRAFQADEDVAGGKVFCPYCGDVNRVSGDGGETATRAEGRPVGAAAGSDRGTERSLLVLRPAMFRGHPFLYLLIVALFLGGLALAVLGPSVPALASTPGLGVTGLGMMGAGVLAWLAWWIAPHRWTKLLVTTRRTIRQEGIVMRKTSEVLHAHIRNVKIEQSFLQRLLNVGSIWIDSAGGSEGELVEIEMHHVIDPYGVKKVIDQYRGL